MGLSFQWTSLDKEKGTPFYKDKTSKLKNV
jgi:hypothetical protein